MFTDETEYAEDGTGKTLKQQLDTSLNGDLAGDNGKETKDSVAHIEQAIFDLKRLQNGEDLDNNGWYGVLHADGNGIGRIFTNLHKAYADNPGSDVNFRTQLSGLNQRLDILMWQVFAKAVIEVHKKYEKKPKDWILPIIIGGDDITAIIDGRYALDFTVFLAEAFAEATDKAIPGADSFEKTLAEVKEALKKEDDNSEEALEGNPPEGNGEDTASIPDKVSLGAGLAFVKPHHPFLHAVELAEELAGNAKKLTRHNAALDVQVVYEPALRALTAARADTTLKVKVTDSSTTDFEFRTYLGAFLIAKTKNSADPEQETYDQTSGGIDNGKPTLDEIRSLHKVLKAGKDRQMSPLGGDSDKSEPISSSAIHRLREALTNIDDVSAYEAQVNYELEQLRYILPKKQLDAYEILTGDLIPDRASTGSEKFSLANFSNGQRIALITALELLDVTQGTAAGRSQEDA